MSLSALCSSRLKLELNPTGSSRPSSLCTPSKRSDPALFLRISKSAHPAVRRADALDFDHPSPLIRGVWLVQLLGNHSRLAGGRQLDHPLLRLFFARRSRLKANKLVFPYASKKAFEFAIVFD
jgi:hypothetical protein